MNIPADWQLGIGHVMAQDHDRDTCTACAYRAGRAESLDLDSHQRDALWLTNGDTDVVIRRSLIESCPSCSCDWIDWNGRYLCGYQPGKGRARFRCRTIEAWKETR